MQNKLDMLFQLFQAIGGPNHTMIEHSLLNQCNHKVGLNGPMANCLTWHTVPNSISQIIPWDMIAFIENSSGHKLDLIPPRMILMPFLI